MAAIDFSKAFRVLADEFKQVAESAAPNAELLAQLKAEAMLRLRKAHRKFPHIAPFLPWDQYKKWEGEPMLAPSTRQFGWAALWDNFVGSLADRELDFPVPDPLSTRVVAREDALVVSVSTGNIVAQAHGCRRACEWLVEQFNTSEKRKPGRKADPATVKLRNDIAEAWKDYQKEAPTKKPTYVGFAEWCRENRDELPELSEKEIGKHLHAHRQKPDSTKE